VCTLEEAAPSGPPFVGQPNPLRRDHVEVKQVLSCGQYVPGRTISLDQVDMDDITGGGDGGGGGSTDNSNKNPFRFEKGHMLGTSDMQIRALVIGNAITETAPTQQSDRVVGDTRWLPEAQENNNAGGFLGNVRDWGRLTTALAEYYFDPRGLNSDDPFANLNKQRDWLWVMGWSARLRRFRMSFDGTDANGNAVNADGPSRKGDSEDDKSMAQELSDNGMFEALSGNGPACDRSRDPGDCQDNAGLLSRFDKLFLH
jgi:hypothetical protein